MNRPGYDIAIIGGGIVGLATALALTERYPGHSVVVIEKEPHLATHQTGHNSGVIHSGIYYRPGSHKARLCVEGATLLMRFCDAHAIAYERCGKAIVATDERELPLLASLYERGLANGVPGLRLIEADPLREIEPHARALRALYSPHTAIVDYRAVARALEATIRRQGADILTGTRVAGIVRADGILHLQTNRGDVRARYLINCGGLYSDAIARMAGAQPDVRIIPFRGEYYTLRADRRHLVKGLIYPVPDPQFPFLGVHFTRTIHGEVEAGPNAVLAFAREGYTLFRIHPAEMWATVTYRGFWAMAGRYWRTGLYEFYRSISQRAFVQALRRLVPHLEDSDVAPGGAGVRAQAVRPDGTLVDDFTIVPTPQSIHVLNAPSPAATASLAIGRYLAGLAAESFSLKA
ncbi:MAG: L-2-hydroxyglutarate oxidase [Acidobacteria bacterium]|nr:L-2-hydroxyglutarate oxidase [Acidobacteriota bacterium]